MIAGGAVLLALAWRGWGMSPFGGELDSVREQIHPTVLEAIGIDLGAPRLTIRAGRYWVHGTSHLRLVRYSDQANGRQGDCSGGNAAPMLLGTSIDTEGRDGVAVYGSER